MTIAPISADGWKFEITDSKLLITSDQNDKLQIQLSARAAFSLLNYLYQERNDLQEASQRETTEEVKMKKEEGRSQSIYDEGMSDQQLNSL
jgi:hypothetical protein